MKLIDIEKVREWVKKKLASYHPTEITSGRYALADLLLFLDTLPEESVKKDLKEAAIMKEIEIALLELQRLLKTIPQECKGDSPTATKERRRYMRIKSTISSLIEEEL